MEDIEALNERNIYLLKRKAQYQANKERISLQIKARKEKNPEKFALQRKKSKEKNKAKVIASAKEYYLKNKGLISEKSKMRRVSKDLDELNNKIKEKRANRTDEEKIRYSEYAKQYRQKNKDKIKAYREGRKDISRANKRIWHHKKYREDILYKITHNLRSRVKHAIRCGLKTEKTITLLGCTTSQLKTHIESLFTEGMNWEIFMTGDIHVDHIKPCSKFDLTKRDEQIACFNYKNLQPLWWYDNLAKSDNYEEQKVA